MDGFANVPSLEHVIPSSRRQCSSWDCGDFLGVEIVVDVGGGLGRSSIGSGDDSPSSRPGSSQPRRGAQ